jgi:hypothetical protein
MSYKSGAVSMLVLLIMVAVCPARAGNKNAPPSQKISKGAKVFIAPIANGYETFLKDAMATNKGPGRDSCEPRPGRLRNHWYR